MEQTYICDTCGMPGVIYDWVVVPLDESHELVWSGYECPEGLKVVEVDTIILVPHE